MNEEVPSPKLVQVAVPEHLVPDVYALITERLAAEKGEPIAKAEAAWGEDSLRQLAGHHNEQLRKLLTYVAEQSPDWVPIADAMAAAGRDAGKGAGGFFARLNASSKHRYGRELPIVREYRPDLNYRMDEDTAHTYLRVVNEK